MPNKTKSLEEILAKLNTDSEFAANLQTNLINYVAEQEAQVTKIVSAVPLADSEKKVIESVFLSLGYTYSVDASLLGGLKITKGDQVIDMSLAGKLTTLTNSL